MENLRQVEEVHFLADADRRNGGRVPYASADKVSADAVGLAFLTDPSSPPFRPTFAFGGLDYVLCALLLLPVERSIVLCSAFRCFSIV